jgi:hypothetical protein
MSIFKTLNFTNIDIGNLQSDDEMTIVPLIGDDRGDVAPPEDLQFKRTTDYGTMVFENTGSKQVIVPSNIMTRGIGGQDHAMSGSGIVSAKATTSFTNACCIEETQGGFLGTNVEMDILPITLRKAFLDINFRNTTSYRKLWGKIQKWLQGLPVRNTSRAHLRYFYDEPFFKNALENFAAAFEPVTNQLGAIVMFANVPVGIEIMPTNEHWKEYWKLLIRGCYGAELLRLRQLGLIQRSTLALPSIPDGSTANEVRNIMSQYSQNIRQQIIPMVDQISIASNKQLTKSGSLQSNLITTTSGGGGDVIEQGGTPIYMSVVL